MILAKFDFSLLFFIFQLAVSGSYYFWKKTRPWWGYTLAVFLNLYLVMIFISVVVQNLIINFFTTYGEVPYLTGNNLILNLTLVVLDQIPELTYLRSYIYVDHVYYPLSGYNFVFGINLNNFQRLNLMYYFLLALPGVQILLTIRWVKQHWSTIGDKFYQITKQEFLFRYFVAWLIIIQVLLVVFTFLLFYSSFYLDVCSSLTLLTNKLYYIQHVLGQDYAIGTRVLALEWSNQQEHFVELQIKHYKLTYLWLTGRAFLASFGALYFRIGIEYFVRCGETR